MSLGAVLFPALMSALLFVVFRKTGLPKIWWILALFPFLAVAIKWSLIWLGFVGVFNIRRIFPWAPLFTSLLTLMPIAVLAFVKWPNRRQIDFPETHK